MLGLFAASMTEMMSIICHAAPDLTDQGIKDKAEELFPYRMGMNNHKDLYYWGMSCRDTNE